MAEDIPLNPALLQKLAGALSFICGADHAATKAAQQAAHSKSERDIKAARAQFLKLKLADRRAALTMIND